MDRKIGLYNVSRAAAKLTKKDPENETVPSGPASYEEAVAAAGFGKFNMLLLFLGAMPANWMIVGSMTNISQIIPSLRCYFQLSLSQVGILNASLFIGNICSSFLWGYLADTVGRRKVMIFVSTADFIFIIISAFSVNVEMLSTLKALSGFVTTAPGPVILAYLSECHGNKHRTGMILGYGVLMSCYHFILPLISWGIIPNNFYYVNSWQVYMMICAFPSFVTFISFMFFPETPRYLMNAGKHDEALAVFKNIYAINSGNAPEQYPIKQLLCENKHEEKSTEDKRNISQMVHEKWMQFRPVFHKPYFNIFILTNLMHILLMLSVYTLRSWLPDIVNLMYHFNSNSSVNLCYMIQEAQNRSLAANLSNETLNANCAEVQSSTDVYVKLTLVGVLPLIMYTVVTALSFVINRKIVLGCLFFISGVAGIGLIWYTNPIIILLVCALFTAQTGVAMITFLSIVVNLFPISFRAFALSIVATSGRLASVLGNLIFPALLVSGCTPPFIYLGACVLACIIPIIALNEPDNED